MWLIVLLHIDDHLVYFQIEAIEYIFAIKVLVQVLLDIWTLFFPDIYLGLDICIFSM